MTIRTIIDKATAKRRTPARDAARRQFLERVVEDPAGLAEEIAALIPEDQRGRVYTWTQGQLFSRLDEGRTR